MSYYGIGLFTVKKLVYKKNIYLYGIDEIYIPIN